jgi:hypothetical protein
METQTNVPSTADAARADDMAGHRAWANGRTKEVIPETVVQFCNRFGSVFFMFTHHRLLLFWLRSTGESTGPRGKDGKSRGQHGISEQAAVDFPVRAVRVP